MIEDEERHDWNNREKRRVAVLSTISKKKVLVVEDNEINRAMLYEILAEEY